MFLIFSLLYNLPFSRGATWETRIEIVVDLEMPHLSVPIRFASEQNAYLRKIFGSYNAFFLQTKCKGWKGVMDNLWSFSFGSPNSMVSCHRLVWFLVYCTNFCHFFYKNEGCFCHFFYEWRAAWKFTCFFAHSCHLTPPQKKNTSHHKKPNGGSVWRCWNWFHREKRNEVKSVWKWECPDCSTLYDMSWSDRLQQMCSVYCLWIHLLCMTEIHLMNSKSSRSRLEWTYSIHLVLKMSGCL